MVLIGGLSIIVLLSTILTLDMFQHELVFCAATCCCLCRYETEFGFTMPSREIIVDDVRVRATGKCISPEEPDLETDNSKPEPVKVNIGP